jgi:hypothetical protein
MTPIIEDSVLGTDLDAQFHSLLNVKSLDPVPLNLATSDDIRLTDVREPIPGSVVNASVAPDAAIEQSKLNLNGSIPTAWLGTTAGTAAPGDLAEYLSNKNQPGGYAGLDNTGQIPVSMLPDSVGLATVTSVGITLPPELVLLPGSTNPITGSGVFKIGWLPMSDAAWFGRISGSGAPTFQYTPIPISLVPNLNAAQVTSGQFPSDRMTVAIYGAGSAPGAVPDPGPSTGDPTDYLARNMTFMAAPIVAVGYQPQLPDPTFSKQADGSSNTKVFAGSTVGDVVFFYSVTSNSTGFAEFPNPGYVTVPNSSTGVWIYSSRVGWNNSNAVHVLPWP